MRTLASTKTRQVVGVTVGQKKDGSIAVLFDDNQLRWYSAAEFTDTFEVV